MTLLNVLTWPRKLAMMAWRLWALKVTSLTSLSPREQTREKDRWGSSYENRIRFPLEIIKRTRERVGDDFIIIYRLSILDLVNGGSQWDEIRELAKKVESCGATIINSGIGWHESRVPTIATRVPRGAFAEYSKEIKNVVNIPMYSS